MLCLGAENQAILHCPTLARLCYSTLFSLTGLFQDCSAQEDVWTFWKNHHFFSESIHRQFVLCVCVCVCVCARTHKHACSIVSDSLQPPGLLYPWNFPGKNAGVGRHSLFQGIFPMQGSNPCLLHPVFQGDSLPLCHLGSPKSAAPSIPRQSPIQGLTGPTLLSFWDQIRSGLFWVVMAGSLCPKIILNLSSQNPYLAVSLILNCYLLVLTQSSSSPCIERASNSSKSVNSDLLLLFWDTTRTLPRSWSPLPSKL